MKKIKSTFCALLLSLLLCGSVFAGETTAGGFWTFWNGVMETVESFFNDDDTCPTRVCTNCRPGLNCRPVE